MDIIIGSDHRGFHLKEVITNLLKDAGHVVRDVGTNSEESVDYPAFAHMLTQYASSVQKGILICGSGIGVCMAANRSPHIRAATCRTVDDAVMTRKHNDANVLCIGADVTTQVIALAMVEAFLGTEFEGGRHERRVRMI